ncbi:MAG TPA: AraC family ligand binding domain-containing protein, partial [Verrucomicrobiae bacterium]
MFLTATQVIYLGGMRRLTPRETRQTLRRIGINQAREAAFAYADPRRQVRYHFHHHNRHQLLYAMSGSLFLETRSGAWLLPPQRAAWIPAGVRHATTVRNAETRSLYFSPRTFATIEPDIRILEMTPLLREMILYAQQWPADAKGTEPFRRQFFDVLMTLLQRQSRTLDRCRLPRPTSAGLERATNSFLADVAQGGVAAAARR